LILNLGIWSANDGTIPTGIQQFDGKFEATGWTGQTTAAQIPNQGWNVQDSSQVPVQVQVNGHNDQTWSINGQMENPLSDQAKLWTRSPVVSLPATMQGLREEVKAEPDQMLQNAQINATQAMLNEYQQLHQLQLLQVKIDSDFLFLLEIKILDKKSNLFHQKSKFWTKI